MTKSQPIVTVICLCYNHENFVIASLNSVINQTYKNIELIIIDDASTDSSASLITMWNTKKKFTFIKNKTNIGPNKSFNKGLRQAKGKYIIDLAADDILTKNSILLRVKKFYSSKYKNLGVVFSNVESIDQNENHIEYRYPIDNNFKANTPPPTGYIYKEVVHSYFISSPSMLIKKEVFDKLNGYDEELNFEDLDFCIRSSKYFNYDYVDEILVKKRVLKNSLGSQFCAKTKRGKKLGQSTLKICQKTYYLNSHKEEHIALKNRIIYSLKLNTKANNFSVVLGLLLLFGKLQFKILTYN